MAAAVNPGGDASGQREARLHPGFIDNQLAITSPAHKSQGLVAPSGDGRLRGRVTQLGEIDNIAERLWRPILEKRTGGKIQLLIFLRSLPNDFFFRNLSQYFLYQPFSYFT